MVRLEAAVPSKKENMVRLPAHEEDTQEWTPAGSFRANLNPIKLPSSASSASFSARGFLAQLVLEEGLRGATRSPATFFGHVLQLAW